MGKGRIALGVFALLVGCGSSGGSPPVPDAGPPPAGCAIPGYPSERPLTHMEVRGRFACNDGALYNFDLPRDSTVARCDGDPERYAGVTWDMHQWSAGAVAPGVDGCSACACGYDGVLRCVDACSDVSCTYDGVPRAAGEAFMSTDRFNVCACRADGTVVCTGEQPSRSVGCDTTGGYVAESRAVPTPMGECAPCWCENGAVECISMPSCDQCQGPDGMSYPIGASESFAACPSSCTCTSDAVWDCDGDCPELFQCELHDRAYPLWAAFDHEANRYSCEGVWATTSAGGPLCRAFGEPRFVGEIFHSADGCRACICGGAPTVGSGTSFGALNSACVDICTPTCEVDGRWFGAGEVFRAADGCNACVCGGDGNVVCTDADCPDVACTDARGGERGLNETWLDLDGALPALCRCDSDGEIVCSTDRWCYRDFEGGGDCLPTEVCNDFSCE